MEPWPDATVARWERRSRRVLLVVGVLLLAAYLLPRPRIDGDGALTWMTPFEREDGWLGDLPPPPPPLVPHSLAFVGLGAWYVMAARKQPLARRGKAVAWASVALVLGVAASRAQFGWGPRRHEADLGWPWWDGTWVLAALGLLLARCPGQRRPGRALSLLAGCVGLAPLLLAPAWDVDHMMWPQLFASDRVWPRLFAVAQALGLAASVGLIWFGLGPRRARGRRVVATRLWITSLGVLLLVSVGAFVDEVIEPNAPMGASLCDWLGFLLELSRQLAPLVGLVVGLFLAIATARRPAGGITPAAPDA